jgi:hypothetical protein
MATLVLPRRQAVIPMLIMACFVAPGQRVVLLSLDFTFLRILVLCGFVRLLARQELRGFQVNAMDWLLIAWTVTNTVAYTILNQSAAAFVNRLGFSFDAIGMYLLFRCLINSREDLDRVVMALIVLSAAVVPFFLLEASTGKNLFSVFGGVPAETMVRDGRLRCQGAFAHPILAGCFWASVLPLMGAWWWKRGMARWLAGAGVGCSAVIIVACSSSTPVMAVLFGILGMALFRFRGHMRAIRWGLLGLAVALHLVMNNPVWHLLARVNVVGGSTGWHRYHLIDKAIEHFSEWWLVGTVSTTHWGHGLDDVTNQYILEGVRGGLATMALFIAVIAVAFASVGRARRIAAASSDPYPERLVWAVGVALFVHVTNFMAVSYFGQITMVWYLNLAIAGSLSAAWFVAPAAVTGACMRVRRVGAVGNALKLNPAHPRPAV